MSFESRFAHLGRSQAVLLLIVLLAAIASAVLPQISATAFGPSETRTAEKTQARGDDLLLYKTIIARVAAGEHYYATAAQEQRAGNYPLKPFVTVRLPTLAYLLAWLGPIASYGLLISLLGMTLWAYWHRLNGAFTDSGRRITGVLLIAAGASIVFQPKYAVLHEVWAGLLIALAVALKGSSRWYLAVLVGAAALMIRELALPCILLMTAFALFERRWRECIAWVALIVLFGVVMTVHASHVAMVVRPDDLSSQGWMNIGGWQGYLRSMRLTSSLRVFPDWAANIGVIIACFGWVSWRSMTGLLGTLLLAGYAIIFMILGRPENFYWGLLNAPMLLLGWAFLPQAFKDLGSILLRPKANWT